VFRQFHSPRCDACARESIIKQARADVKAAKKNGNGLAAPQPEQRVKVIPAKEAVFVESKTTSGKPSSIAEAKPHKGLTKLRKMLYLQSGRCFFCGELLKEEDASIEHLNPKSRGGSSTEGNEVVCHKSLNQVFGSMDLKAKFAFVVNSKGAFRCPKV
jgi:hypothetical protein